MKNTSLENNMSRYVNTKLHPLELKWAYGVQLAATIMRLRGYTFEQTYEILLGKTAPK